MLDSFGRFLVELLLSSEEIIVFNSVYGKCQSIIV